jgi:ferredoxin
MCLLKDHAAIPKFEKKYSLSDIYTKYFSSYLVDKSRCLYLSEKHHRAVRQSINCRIYGHNQYACEGCGDCIEISYSCHHRFCARCGAAASNKWAMKLTTKLVSVKHGHVVMTVPYFLRGLCKRNQSQFYEAMFRTSALAIQQIIWEKYGVKLGLISVLHTYGSDLKYHPHNHIIVSLGGVKKDCWLNLQKKYLCDHTALGNRYKELLCAELLKLYSQNALNMGHPDKSGTEGALEEGEDMSDFLKRHEAQNWIVGINLDIEDTQHLIGYCGRYLRRACLSEYRIVSIENQTIQFRFKDYKNTPRGEKTIESLKSMSATAFLDALLQHVPDKGFVGVRYYGIYANACKILDKCHKLPQKSKQTTDDKPQTQKPISDLMQYRQTAQHDILFCPHCEVYRQLIYSSLHGRIFKVQLAINDS